LLTYNNTIESSYVTKFSNNINYKEIMNICLLLISNYNIFINSINNTNNNKELLGLESISKHCNKIKIQEKFNLI